VPPSASFGSVGASARAFRHEALPYGGSAQFVPACRSVVEAARADACRLMVLASGDRLDAVRRAVDDDEITYVPTDQHGRNPSRLCALLDSFASGANGARPVAIADWGFPGRSAAVDTELRLTESLLNLLSERTPALEVTCLYDEESVGPEVLDAMRRSHPFLRGRDGNPEYDAGLAAALYAAALPDPSTETRGFEVGRDNLSAARRTVRGFAITCGLSDERADDLVVAANEMITNSIRYGGGRGRVSLWQDGETVICQVVDSGRMTDPLIGRFAPVPTAGNGRGLWLAHQLCDLVQLRSSDGGTVVRLHVDRL
jgi:anti-sigma regulatory factor (Ser/Thr protein kinase)